VDFTFAMTVVHETPGGEWFFKQFAETMKPGASLLLAEPAGHVKEPAADAGLVAAGPSCNAATPNCAAQENRLRRQLMNFQFPQRSREEIL
jgi:hypothetical protein